MKLFTYSDARQQFSKVLDTARKEGKVLIRRRDGSLFSLVAEKSAISPFDVKGISTKVTTPEIVDFLRSERKRTKRSSANATELTADEHEWGKAPKGANEE